MGFRGGRRCAQRRRYHVHWPPLFDLLLHDLGTCHRCRLHVGHDLHAAGRNHQPDAQSLLHWGGGHESRLLQRTAGAIPPQNQHVGPWGVILFLSCDYRAAFFCGGNVRPLVHQAGSGQRTAGAQSILELPYLGRVFREHLLDHKILQHRGGLFCGGRTGGRRALGREAMAQHSTVGHSSRTNRRRSVARQSVGSGSGKFSKDQASPDLCTVLDDHNLKQNLGKSTIAS
mmetsp:Transcript_21956/g.61016  ORF Transcript_21956/g.61016 Transcript_21956/m.61016 type:complete len:229 (-) Transcript_21956:9772-10458(-)